MNPSLNQKLSDPVPRFFHFKPDGLLIMDFLWKNIMHKAEGCEVCKKQIKTVTFHDPKSDQDLSIPQGKIFEKINFPEVTHHEITCQSCGCSPIIGNAFRCFTSPCKDFISCESCYDAKKHEHTLIYVSSKL